MYIWFFASIIGIFAGVLTPGAWYLFQEFQNWYWDLPLEKNMLAYLLPFGASCAIAFLFLSTRVIRTADAFTYFISDLQYNDGRRNFFACIVHGFASFLLILGGGVVGIEALSFEWLTALGSKFGDWKKLTPFQIKTLSACGLTAVFSAMLGQPAPAFLFSVELLYGWGSAASSIGPLALTAFLAASVSRTLTAPTGFFHSLTGTDGGLSFTLRGADFSLHGLSVLYSFAFIAVAAAALAIITIWLFRKTDQDLHTIFATRRSSDFSFPAFFVRLSLWTVLTGLMLHKFPDSIGSGVKLVQSSMWNDFILLAATVALVARLLLGAVSYSVIGSAGLIMPILVMGSLLGSTIYALTIDFIAVSNATLALLGIGAFFSAAFGVPVTATALVYGYAGGVVSENAEFLFTAICANFLASFLCGLVHKDRLGTMGLYRHGIRFRNGMCFNTLSSITVRDAMLSWVTPILNKSSLGDAYKTLMESRFLKLPVVNADKDLTGLLSLGDFYALETWKNLEKNSQVYDLLGIEDIIKPAFIQVHADMSLEEALKIMGDEDTVPVVEPENKRFVGMLLKSDLVNLYNKEVVKKAFKR